MAISNTGSSLSESRPDWPSVKKIAIFRALQLGDLLCAIPAVRSLKSACPHAEIFLIGLPGSEALTSRFNHYFSGMIPFPGYPGLPEQAYDIHTIARFIADMQYQHFDLLLQMQGNGTLVNPFVELLGARYTAGFYTPGDYKPPGNLFIPYPGYGHEILRHLMIMRHLGIMETTPELEFPVKEEDRIACDRLNLRLERRHYICIHPGSRGWYRQWPRENFARMADLCMENGFQVVLTGTADEYGIVSEVAGFMSHVPVIVAGKTNLGSMAVLLSDAYALVSNCTGVSHMAAALHIPGIIISMDGEPERWGPLDQSILYTLNWLENPDFKLAESALQALLKKGSFRPDPQYA